MPGTPLKSAPSALNANVTLFSLPDPGPSKHREPPSQEFTTMRRTTRSSRSSVKAEPVNPQSTGPTPGILSAYAYQPTATPPRKRVKVELEAEDELKPVKLEDEDGTTTPKSKRAKSKPMPVLALDKPHPEPPRWKEQYRLIERMRKGIVAPVDDMWVSC